MYPKELYKHDEAKYRVVHGAEEHAAFTALGWADTPNLTLQYRVYSADEHSLPSMDEALAAGYSQEAAEKISSGKQDEPAAASAAPAETSTESESGSAPKKPRGK